MKTSKPVDKSLLTTSIEQAEKNGGFKNFSLLCQTVAVIYNNKCSERITSSIVGLRIGSWKIPIKTKVSKRGASIEVDKAALLASVDQAEQNGPLPKLSDLWAKVTEIYNKKSVPEQLNEATIRSKIVAWKLPILTVKAKRTVGPMSDEHKAALMAGRTGKRVSRSAKFAKDPQIVAGHKLLKRETPAAYLPIVDRISQGSLMSAVKLQCLSCSAFNRTEIKFCEINSCPLFAFRPYKPKLGETAENPWEETEEEIETFTLDLKGEKIEEEEEAFT